MPSTGKTPATPPGIVDALRHPRSGVAGYVVAGIAAAAVGLVWLLLREHTSAAVISDLTTYRPSDSGWLTTPRMLLAALAPTDPLPVWVAALEMFIGVAVGCAVLGWRVALAVGVTAHVTATVVARLALDLPASWWGHLGEQYRYDIDTGPSVILVSLVFCSLLVASRPWLAGVFVVGVAATGSLDGTLAGEEHGIGLLVGAIAAAVIVARRRRAT